MLGGWSFAQLLFVLLVVGIIRPFLSTTELGNAVYIGLGISGAGAFFGTWASHPAWARDKGRTLGLLVGTLGAATVTSLAATFPVLARDDWKFLPPMMQAGFAWSQGYWAPLLQVAAAAFTCILGAGTALQVVGTRAPRRTRASELATIPLLGTALLAGLTWGFLHVGYVIVNVGLFLGNMVALLLVGTWFVQERASKTRDTRAPTIPNTAPTPPTGASSATRAPRDPRIWCFLALFLELVFVSFFVGIVLHNLFPEMNFLPFLVDWGVILVVATAAWGLVLHVTRENLVPLVGGPGAAVIAFGILASDPWALYAAQGALYWLTAFAVSGVWVGWYGAAGRFRSGPSARAAWGAFTGFFIPLLFFYSLISDILDPMDALLWQLGLPLGLVSGALGVFAWVGARRANRARATTHVGAPSTTSPTDSLSSLPSEPASEPPSEPPSEPSSESPASTSTVLPARSPASRARARPARARPGMPSWKTVMVVVVILGLAVVPAFLTTAAARRSDHVQVVGSYEDDYYLWVPRVPTKVDRFQTPALASYPTNHTVRLLVARGEHEGFQVIFTPWALRDLAVWQFEPTGPLRHETLPGAQIPVENLSIYRVGYVPQLHDQLPDRLLPFQRFDTARAIVGQRNWPLYVDVAVPRDPALPAGVYATTLDFRCRDYRLPPPDVERQYVTRNVTLRLEVRVLDVTLPLERHLQTEIIWGVPEAWVPTYHEYRLDPYWPEAPIASASAEPGNVRLEFDWAPWEQQLAEGFARGMAAFPVRWIPPGVYFGNQTMTPTAEALLRWYVGNVTARLAGKTTPWGTSYLAHAYYFIHDEPPEALYDFLTQIARVIHEVSPDLRIMETLNKELETYPDAFLDEVDIYCLYIHEWIPETGPTATPVEGWPARLADFRDKWAGVRDKRLWVYLTHNRYPAPDTDVYMASNAPRASFWLFWQFNLSGWLYWSFNWNVDQAGGYGYAGWGESRLVNSGPDGQLERSLRLEAVRAGIEDFEYFWLLDHACDVLEATGHATQATPGRALLAEVGRLFDQPDEFPLVTPEKNAFLWHYEQSPEPYLALRDRVGLELERLTPLLATS